MGDDITKGYNIQVEGVIGCTLDLNSGCWRYYGVLYAKIEMFYNLEL